MNEDLLQEIYNSYEFDTVSRDVPVTRPESLILSILNQLINQQVGHPISHYFLLSDLQHYKLLHIQHSIVNSLCKQIEKGCFEEVKLRLWKDYLKGGTRSIETRAELMKKVKENGYNEL